MKKLLVVLLAWPVCIFAQNSIKTCQTVSKVNDLLQRQHYRPKPVDDSLSVFIFDSFIDQLDKSHNLFLKSEYEQLAVHRLTLDDEILAGNCNFMDDFGNVYRDALTRRAKIIGQIRDEGMDYTAKDSVQFSKKNFPFEENETQLAAVWKRKMKFEILEDIARQGTNLDSLQPFFDKLEKTSREKIFSTNLCKVSSVIDNQDEFEAELRNNFLNLFCNWFDPHSNYFSSDAKASFMSALSTSNLSMGIYVSLNERDEIVVDEIVPGGPAAKTQQFEKDDVIVRVRNSKGQEYEVSCTSLDMIGDILFSDSNVKVGITLRKKNGTLLDVDLEKQVMKADDTSVYSFVAEKEVKVGYICIPAFYTDFENGGNEGASEDVRKEILKLRQDHVDGIVIDLQDDGGGSMDEAIRMAGMFVDGGPVSVLSDRKQRQTILKDPDRSTEYNGPVVVMVNGNSASASEFFTAALQDYKRAVVIGSTTLGKATMQSIMPVSPSDQENYAKVTVQKFYRISGGSNQIRGIIPDVKMPVLFDSIVPRENAYKTALPYDTIASKARYHKYYPEQVARAAQLSRERILSNARFNEIAGLNSQINKLYSDARKPIQLNLPKVFKEIHSVDVLWGKAKEISARPTGCKVSNNSYDLEIMETDASFRENNESRLKDVQANPYLEEAISIIADLKKLKT